MKKDRVIVPPKILPRSQIIVGLAYRVKAWDATVNVVIVTNVDEDSVTLEYGSFVEDDTHGIDRVPIDYFTDELEACLVARPLPERTDYFRQSWRLPESDNAPEQKEVYDSSDAAVAAFN